MLTIVNFFHKYVFSGAPESWPGSKFSDFLTPKGKEIKNKIHQITTYIIKHSNRDI
jgi:hypothetical protein